MMVVPQQTMISTDVPGADLNTGQAGIVETAAAKASGQFGELGIGLYDKMVKAEAEESYHTKMADLNVKSALKRKQLEMSAVGGYMVDENGERTGKTMTEAYREWANDEFHNAQASMPNQLGQDMIRAGGSKMFAEEIGSVNTTEYAQRASYFDEQRKNRLDVRGNYMLAYPELEKSFEYLDDWHLEQKQGVRNLSLAANREAAVTHAGQDDLAMKFFMGRINHIMEGEVPASLKTGFGGQSVDPKTGKTVSTASVSVPLGQLGAVQDLIRHLENQNGDPIDAALHPSYVDPDGRSASREAQHMPSPRSALTPENKDKLLNQLYTLEKRYQTKEGNDFDQRIHSIKMGLYNGQPWSDQTFADAFAMGMSVKKNDPDKGIHVVEGLMQLLAQKHIRDFIPTYDGDPAPIKVASTEEQKRVKESGMKSMAQDAAMLSAKFGLSPNDQSFAGQVAISEYNKEFEALMAKTAGDFEKDPASHVARYNGSVRKVFSRIPFDKPESWTAEQKTAVQTAMNTIQQTKLNYKQHGQPSPNDAYLPKDAAEAISKSLNDLKANPALGVKRFNVLREGFGPQFEGSLDQMIDNKQVRPEMRLVALMGDKMRQQRVFDLLAREGGARDVNLLFNGKFDKEEELKLRGEVVKSTQVKLSYMYRNDPKGDTRQKIAHVQEAILLHAKDMMYQNNMDAPTAAKSAEEFFLGDKKLDTIKTGLFGFGGSTVVYPEVLNDGSSLSDGQKRQIDSWVKRNFTLENFKKLPWDIPKNLGGVTPEKFIEHVYDNLAEENIRFGADPNDNPQLQKYGPVQGIWITTPAVRNKNTLMNMPPRLMQNGQSKIFFIPKDDILRQQTAWEQQEKAKAENLKKQMSPIEKGTWGHKEQNRNPQGGY